jgi:pre-mRNA-splicing factor 38A
VFQEDFEESRKQLEKEKAKREEELQARKEKNEILEEEEAPDKRQKWQRGSHRPRDNRDNRQSPGREWEDRRSRRDGEGGRSRERSPPPGRSCDYGERPLSRRGGPRRRERPRSPPVANADSNKGGELNKEDLAIAEANALRAKLGLKPLKM